MALKRSNTQWVLLEADHGPEHVEDPDQHRGAVRSILPDHVKHRIHEPVIVNARNDQYWTTVLEHYTGGQVQRTKVTEPRRGEQRR